MPKEIIKEEKPIEEKIEAKSLDYKKQEEIIETKTLNNRRLHNFMLAPDLKNLVVHYVYTDDVGIVSGKSEELSLDTLEISNLIQFLNNR